MLEGASIAEEIGRRVAGVAGIAGAAGVAGVAGIDGIDGLGDGRRSLALRVEDSCPALNIIMLPTFAM